MKQKVKNRYDRTHDRRGYAGEEKGGRERGGGAGTEIGQVRTGVKRVGSVIFVGDKCQHLSMTFLYFFPLLFMIVVVVRSLCV